MKMLSMKGIYLETKSPTFPFNRTVVSKLISLELDFELSHVYLENRSLDHQCHTGVGSNVTVE